ncbi:MAG: helical backbone metal receptor [Eubacteriaceae bacterium]|nr:helical backbone metal receptor [Eubacteriaceae bacterium]
MKKTLALLLALMIAFAFASCGGQANNNTQNNSQTGSASTTYPLSLTDGYGNSATIEAKPEKIVSLSPGVTEALFAIGAGPQMIGRSEWCTYPAEAASLATVGNAYAVDIEKIIELQADIVIVSGIFGGDSVSALNQVGIPVISINYDSIDALYESVAMLGQISDRSQEAEALVTSLKADLAALEAACAGFEARKVFMDLGSLYSSSKADFLGNSVQKINCVNIAFDFDFSSPQLSAEAVIEADPDVYIATYDEGAETHADGFEEIAAFKNGEVYYIPYVDERADMILRQGPRFVEGLKILAAMIHPEAQL